MATDHQKPTITSNYTDVIDELHARIDDAALQFDPEHTDSTNIPKWSIQYNPVTGKKRQWDGNNWQDTYTDWSAPLVTKAQAEDKDNTTAYKWSPKRVWESFKKWAENLGTAAERDVGTKEGDVFEVSVNGSLDLSEADTNEKIKLGTRDDGDTMALEYSSTNIGFYQRGDYQGWRFRVAYSTGEGYLYPGGTARKIYHEGNQLNIGTSAASARSALGLTSNANIPNLPASKITSGTFADARIPSMNASKINAGTFAAARIPSLPASKITSGRLHINRQAIPSNNQVGSYVFGGTVGSNPGTTSPGGTRAGSQLRYAGIASGSTYNQNNPETTSINRGSTTSLSGTWKAMGRAGSTGANPWSATLWVRIS